MKQLKNVLSPVAIACIALFWFGCRKPASTCDTVNGTGKGNIVSQTASGATTVSNITGSGGIDGSTIGTLVFTGADTASGALLFKGDIVLTTTSGTLAFSVLNGKLNPVTGEFTNDAYVTTGTGSFKGATGSLLFRGFTFADGSFVDDKINGEICRKAALAIY